MSSLEIGRLCFVNEINPCRARSFSNGFRALFAGLNTLSRIMGNGFLWREPENICPDRNELAFTVLRLYGFPSTDFSGFCVKNVSTWLTVLPAPCFQVRLEVFLSFLYAKVGRERLVYFIVSNHSVLNLYFIKWLGLNLRRTTFDLLVTFFTFKDIDSMFWWLFCTFRNSTCHQLFNVTIARLSNTSFGFLPC